jgi:spore germination protein KB
MIYPVRCVGVEGGKKQLIKGFLWSGLILFTTVFLSILVLGFNITAKSTAPTILLAREINVGMILSRLEYVIAVIWTITQFFASTLFFYTGIIGISEFLGLRDYRKIAVPMGMLMLVLSGIVFPDDLYRIDWVNTVWIPYIFTVGLALQLLLFIVSLIKRLVLKKT